MSGQALLRRLRPTSETQTNTEVIVQEDLINVQEAPVLEEITGLEELIQVEELANTAELTNTVELTNTAELTITAEPINVEELVNVEELPNVEKLTNTAELTPAAELTTAAEQTTTAALTNTVESVEELPTALKGSPSCFYVRLITLAMWGQYLLHSTRSANTVQVESLKLLLCQMTTERNLLSSEVAKLSAERDGASIENCRRLTREKEQVAWDMELMAKENCRLREELAYSKLRFDKMETKRDQLHLKYCKLSKEINDASTENCRLTVQRIKLTSENKRLAEDVCELREDLARSESTISTLEEWRRMDQQHHARVHDMMIRFATQAAAASDSDDDEEVDDVEVVTNPPQ